MAKFLTKIGCNDLEICLRAHKKIEIKDAIDILKKDFEKISAILVFDDFHKSSDEIMDFFICFIKLHSTSTKVKIIILSRQRQLYLKAPENMKNQYIELELNGLDFIGTNKWLSQMGINEKRIEEIQGISNGNPLFIESMVNIEGYINDEMYSYLSNSEIELIGLLSILRFSIPLDYLINFDSSYSKFLPHLVQKSIVKTDTNNLYNLHDLVKQFFYQKLSDSQRYDYHQYAGNWFKEKKEPLNLLESVYHFQMAEEFEKAAQVAIDVAKHIFEGGLAGEFLNILERFDEKSLETDIWAKVLILKGKAYCMLGEWKKGLLHFNFGGDFASLSGHNEIKARALCEAGHVLE